MERVIKLKFDKTSSIELLDIGNKKVIKHTWNGGIGVYCVSKKDYGKKHWWHNSLDMYYYNKHNLPYQNYRTNTIENSIKKEVVDIGNKKVVINHWKGGIGIFFDTGKYKNDSYWVTCLDSYYNKINLPYKTETLCGNETATHRLSLKINEDDEEDEYINLEISCKGIKV
jgi:hypothetical protein